MDKMMETQRDHTISNDGATILNLLDIGHPAARILVEISKISSRVKFWSSTLISEGLYARHAILKA